MIKTIIKALDIHPKTMRDIKKVIPPIITLIAIIIWLILILDIFNSQEISNSKYRYLQNDLKVSKEIIYPFMEDNKITYKEYQTILKQLKDLERDRLKLNF